jgi:adenylate kinase family enzyme
LPACGYHVRFVHTLWTTTCDLAADAAHCPPEAPGGHDHRGAANNEFRRIIAARAAAGGWVIDGNYGRVRDLVWARADTVVWLDLPKRTVMRQVVWRTLRRVALRRELWNGNRERWRNFLTWNPEQSVISWAWHKHAPDHAKYAAAAAGPASAHLRFIRLASRRDIARFLDDARSEAGAAAVRPRRVPRARR